MKEKNYYSGNPRAITIRRCQKCDYQLMIMNDDFNRRKLCKKCDNGELEIIAIEEHYAK